MPSKSIKLMANSTLVAMLLAILQVANAAELSTLFTTPQERELINSNRYKSDDNKVTQQVAIETAIEGPIQLLLQEEVTREYKISGITISRDGPHTVWINSTAYEDGEELEDNSKIRIMVRDGIKVRITAPDGKHYYATSGELIEVTYLTPVEN